jgi:ABC-type oligopeptide transport system ATPase subunit
VQATLLSFECWQRSLGLLKNREVHAFRKHTQIFPYDKVCFCQGGTLTLDSKTPGDFGIPTWRSRITYIPQSRISPKGTPSELFYVAQVCLLIMEDPLSAAAETPRYDKSVCGLGPSQCSIGRRTAKQSMPLCVQQFSAQRRRPRGDLPALVHALGLEQAVLNQPWTELSGGQSQRVLLAICLALKPDFVLLDGGSHSPLHLQATDISLAK